MARFRPRKGLDELVARMVVPQVEELARSVRDEQRKLAPPTKEWVTMRDDRVRPEHRKTDRQVVPGNLRFELPSHPWDREHRGLGPHTYMRFPKDETSRAVVNIINCFPGDTLVSAVGIQKAFWRWYDGPVVRIETQDGRFLTGTPNHPVLTDRRWVTLGSLDVGDHLVCQRSARHSPRRLGLRAEPDVEHLPARIDEVASALANVGQAQRVSGRAVDFHGDGRKTEVNVVWANRLLHVGVVPALLDELSEFGLANAEVLPEVALDSLRTSGCRVPRPRDAAATFVGKARKALSLLRSRSRMTNHHRFGPSTDRGSSVAEAMPDDIAAYAVRFRERLDGFSSVVAPQDLFVRKDESTPPSATGEPSLAEPSPFQSEIDAARREADFSSDVLYRIAGEVTLDEVRVVHTVPFSGWVYNLETTANWFIANGIVSHNCRCRAVEDPTGISRHINTSPAAVDKAKVTVKVVCDAKDAVASEFGTVYPDGNVAHGAHFMSRGLAFAAAKSRGRR